MTLTSGDLFQIIGMSLLLGGPLIGWVVYWVATSWRDVRIAEQAAVLKKEMLDRGMTAEQIAAVLAAGPQEPRWETDVVLKMVKNGYEGDDIAAVQTAVDHLPADGRDPAMRAAVAMAANGYDGKDIVKFLESKAVADGAPAR